MPQATKTPVVPDLSPAALSAALYLVNPNPEALPNIIGMGELKGLRLIHHRGGLLTLTTKGFRAAVVAIRNDDGLYASQRGEITCGRHTPGLGTDTWIWDRWTRLTDAHRRELRAHGLDHCQSCQLD